MSPQIAFYNKSIFAIEAFFRLSPLNVSQWNFKLVASMKVFLHLLHLFGFLHSVLSNVSSNCLITKKHIRNRSIFWIISTECFQMKFQIGHLNECISAFVAFIWLFSTMCYHMSPQIAFYKKSIFTIEAFWDFINHVFSNEISNWLPQWKYFCICSIYLAFGSKDEEEGIKEEPVAHL